ncbi:MAG TPA: glucokinase [Nevskiaceae bacterium]|nr:glucokinase [Nevskiaceae bacterium]
MTQSNPFPDNFVTGMDVGGTKVHVADTRSSTVQRYKTSDYPDMYTLLDDYFAKIGAQPTHVAVAMAGPRNDETGVIKMTNTPWPAFDPQEAHKRYPNITFSTANDMFAMTAGALQESTINLQQLKPGTPVVNGAKLVVAPGTGLGIGAAVWDQYAKRYTCIASEGGHTSFHLQPRNKLEAGYVDYLHKKHPHASLELAIAGKYGVDNLVDYCLEALQATELQQAIQRARQAERPTGAVLLEFATEGKNDTQKAAHDILECLGGIMGTILSDLALHYKATGGIYLAGSVGLGLGEYLAEKTSMNERFVRTGSVHHDMVQKMPIYLLINPNIAVVGALSLAKQA